MDDEEDFSLGPSEEEMAIRRAEALSTMGTFERGFAESPLGFLYGGDTRDRLLAAVEAERNREAWQNLVDSAPTEEELTARYEDEAFIEGLPSAWATESAEAVEGREGMSDALDAMREWSRGGLTGTDRAMMDENARREAMAARADREAAMSALEARGMGGSGATVASMLAADEGAASRGSAMHADMLAAAQQRQFDATRAMSDIGSRMRGHDETRTGGLEAWRTGYTDYARDLNERNTDRHNSERDNESEAAQRAYENRERATAGVTEQYPGDASRTAERDRNRDENNSNIIQGALELLG